MGAVVAGVLVASLAGLLLLAHPERLTARPAIVANGAVRVVDGDTLLINGDRVRLTGIDAAESDQKCRTASGDSYACGARATAFLAQLAGRAGVSCRPSGRDVNGRTRAVCHAGETELNRALVGAGWALADTRYFVRYGFDQLRARWHAAGLWQGPFVAPWEWRDPQPEFTIDWQLILVVVIVPSFGLVGWARRW